MDVLQWKILLKRIVLYGQWSIRKELRIDHHDVSYNIKLARGIDKVIFAVQEEDNLRDADIILLQEMDSLGTMNIAKALEMNYVYIPAVLHGDKLDFLEIPFYQSIQF